MEKEYAIIEIGSNNTKIHVYKNDELIYEKNITIEFKNNYKINNKIITSDLEKLYKGIEETYKYTDNIHLYGCSIFRNISNDELQSINNILYKKYNLNIEVVSQEDEALYTAKGCILDISYKKNICVLVSGGGSLELLFIEDKKVKDRKYYDFGAVDITNNFPSLKDDYPLVSFDEVTNYISNLIIDDLPKTDIFILAGGNHLYWYDNAGFKMDKNKLYDSVNQKYMIPIDKSDKYDRESFEISLTNIKNKVDSPLWFNGARAMKAITYVIAHKINAKYIIPTKINMEIGIKQIMANN